MGPYYGMQYGQVSSLYGGGYQQPAYSPNYGFIDPTSQGPPYYGTSTSPYTGQTGGGHYGQGHGGNQPYMNQGVVHRTHHPRLPFLTTLNPPDLSRLTNDPVAHDPAWPVVPTKLPSEYLSSRENQERIQANTLLCFTYGALRIPYIRTQFV